MAADPVTNSAPLLEVSDLVVEFDLGRRHPPFRAVDGVSLEIGSRETLGLVGESGSGKTTIGRAILGLTPIKHGTVTFAGADITLASYKERRRLSADLQVVFQDPYSSLNPTRKIGQSLAEPLRVHRKLSRAEADREVGAMLERVGLPLDAAARYPAHFSGGQRQRIAIARALMVQPKLVICDEPVSALDLSVQAQVLNLIRELQSDFGLAYLFIAHDLAVVRHLSHRIMVLYRGQVMELGEAAAVYAQPAHPYTRALLDAAPVPDPEAQRARRTGRQRQRSEAQFPAGASGCPFAARCPFVIDLCVEQRPVLERNPEGTLVACHRWREVRESASAESSSVSAAAPTSAA